MPTTARGPIDAAELGQTLMHEHVVLIDPEIQQNHPEERGSEDDRVADAVRKLNDAAALACGHAGAGRPPARREPAPVLRGLTAGRRPV